MKLVSFIGLMICLSILVVMPVCAYETAQDDITAPYAILSDSWASDVGGGNIGYTQLEATLIEQVPGPTTLIHFDYKGTKSTYLAGATASNWTTFTAWVAGVQIGEGIIGYQRAFTGLGVEKEGWQYIQFTSWDAGALAGSKFISLVWDASMGLSTSPNRGAAYSPAAPASNLQFGSAGGMGGTQTYNRAFAFENSYSATKDLGMGIVGTIWKYSLAHGDTYYSTAFVINASDNQIVTSESSASTTTFHFDIPTESIIIALRDTLGNFHNSTTLFTVRQVPLGVYSINLNPTTLSLPGYVTGTLIGSASDLSKVTDISWSWKDGTGSYDFNENGNTSRPLDYTKVSTTWWQYERGVGGSGGAYSRSKGTTMPNLLSLSNVSSSGQKLVSCYIGTNEGFWYELTADLFVSQGGMQTLILEATDAQSNALVGYTDFAVLDKSTNLWSNVTASGGVYNYLFSYNANLYIDAIATGYGRTTKNWTVLPYSSYILKLPMYPSGTIAATNVSLNVVVLDGATSGVFSNAQVRLSDGQVKSTSGAGVATFTVLAAKSYQIIASYSGYSSATRTLTTTAGGTSQDTYLTLNRIVVTTAPTLPPGVTAVVTLDTRTNAQKDLDMMNQIREYAPMLITLAMLMTMMYLVGYKP